MRVLGSVTNGRPLVALEGVSKRFAIHLETQRSFQESFIRLFQRRHDNREREFWSLQDVTLDVARGDCLGLIGPNGSGKSTLLKLISGILEPTRGRIETNGRIASLLELGSGFHPDLTGRENIYLNAAVYGLSRIQVAERLDDIIAFAELGDFIDMPIRHYSSGMYVRLGFAVAIHTKPDMLLVDEVLSVGDAAFQLKCLESIGEFRSRGGTLVLVSHDLGTIQSLCNRALWLDEGRVRAAGRPVDLVMAYMNQVGEKRDAAAGAKPMALLRQGQRWGTGKMQVTGVTLCDLHGTPHTVFATGAPMQVRLTYRTELPVDDPIFGIAIHHQNGTHICGPNSEFGGLHVSRAAGVGTIIYTVPSLPLLEGSYLLSVSSHNRADTEMFDYHDRAYPFWVNRGASYERYGLVALGGAWQAQPGETVVTEVFSERANDAGRG